MWLIEIELANSNRMISLVLARTYLKSDCFNFFLKKVLQYDMQIWNLENAFCQSNKAEITGSVEYS